MGHDVGGLIGSIHNDDGNIVGFGIFTVQSELVKECNRSDDYHYLCVDLLCGGAKGRKTDAEKEIPVGSDYGDRLLCSAVFDFRNSRSTDVGNGKFYVYYLDFMCGWRHARGDVKLKWKEIFKNNEKRL